MSEEYTLVRDIVSNHNERMLNIKKYYPYFKLSEISFSQYKDGKFEILDMGYILMAVLRFFIEENNFHEKTVSYDEYAMFLHEIFVRDFELNIDKTEEKELASYIFEKLKNDGKPFSYEYFDPIEKKKKTIRTKLIDNKIVDDSVVYFLTADAITFYLDTKEIKDESNITIAQVLLSKMISTKNFKGGTEVIVRINNEVSRLISRKNEILSVMAYDVFAGTKMYEDFMENTVKWFDDEQKLFKKNKELVDKALKNCESDEKYYSAMEDIYQLERELSRAMNKHSELLAACMALQAKTDELVINAKLNRLRPTFDFRKMLSEMVKDGDTTKLQMVVTPLLKLGVKKSFSFTVIDNLLNMKADDEEKAEKIKEGEYVKDFKFPDEIEDKRINDNYEVFIDILFDMLMELENFTLKQYIAEIDLRLSGKASTNADFYSFLVHLCQKKEYEIDKTLEKPDTFLEEIICSIFEKRKDYKKYTYLAFDLEFMDEPIEILENEILNITIVKRW